MSLAHYFGGVLLLAAIVGPPVAAGVLARRRWSAGWGGATAVLADVVAALTTVVVAAEITGAFGQFRRLALVITGVVLLTGVLVLSRVGERRAGTMADAGFDDRLAEDPEDPAAGEVVDDRGTQRIDPRYRRWMTLLSLLVTGVVAAQWVERSTEALGAGVTEFDSLAYHLNDAARFYQSGHLAFLNFVTIDPLHAFHPLNSELLQSIGLVAFHHDVLAPVLNLGWLALLLLAGWCAGRRRGVAPLTLLAAAVIGAMPALIFTAPGAATSDIAATACWAVAIALVVECDGSPSMLAVAGLAGGLAVGSKLTVLAPVGLLAVLVWVILVNRRRLAGLVSFVVATLVSGGFWYLRNALRTGNPLPSLDVGVLPAPDLPIVNKYGFAVTNYLTDGHVWRKVFVPGMRVSFGDSVWLLVALLVAGLVLALWRGGRLSRGLAVVTIISAGAYAATPLTAYGPKGDPLLQIFEANLRYALPVVIVGLLAGLLVLDRFDWRLRPVAAGLLSITALGALIPIDGFPDWRLRVIALAVAIDVVLAVAFLVVHRLGQPRIRRGLPWVAVAVLLVGILVGAEMGPRFVRRRYAFTGGSPPFAVAAWASSVHHQKVGMINYPYGYLLTGRDYTNQVRFLARETPHGGLAPYPSCAAWRRGVDAGHFDALVIGPPDEFTPEPFEQWTASSPGVQLIARDGAFTVFRVTGPLGTQGCPA